MRFEDIVIIGSFIIACLAAMLTLFHVAEAGGLFNLLWVYQ